MGALHVNPCGKQGSQKNGDSRADRFNYSSVIVCVPELNWLARGVYCHVLRSSYLDMHHHTHTHKAIHCLLYPTLSVTAKLASDTWLVRIFQLDCVSEMLFPC